MWYVYRCYSFICNDIKARWAGCPLFFSYYLHAICYVITCHYNKLSIYLFNKRQCWLQGLYLYVKYRFLFSNNVNKIKIWSKFNVRDFMFSRIQVRNLQYSIWMWGIVFYSEIDCCLSNVFSRNANKLPTINNTFLNTDNRVSFV